MNWHLSGKPFLVQETALQRSEGRKGFNFFLEQGLGKTMVALNEAIELMQRGVIDALIVICPNSLKGNWREEAIKWNSGLRVAVWQGKLFTALDLTQSNVFVFNYESQLSSGGSQLHHLLESRRCMLVLDESHRIKNPTSSITKRVLGEYSKAATIKRCLTGTPMTNTVMDYWPQLRMAGALNGSNPIAFRNRFAIVGGFKGKQIIGVKNEEELKVLIAESGFRATKEDWADLPPKVYASPISLPMPKVLQNHYKSMLDEFIVMINDDEAVTAEMVASQYIKLQQISSGFIKDGDTYHQLVATENLPKFEALCDVLEANGAGNVAGQRSKTLVFAHFRHTCAQLIHTLTMKFGPEAVCYLIGGMKDEAIREQKDAFNSYGGPQIMVLQQAAGKEGHTLLGAPGNPCHTVCFYENNFNAGDRLQAEDRPHRYGQINPVLYKDFVSSPIEATVIAAFQAKKSLMQFLLDNKPMQQNT